MARTRDIDTSRKQRRLDGQIGLWWLVLRSDTRGVGERAVG